MLNTFIKKEKYLCLQQNRENANSFVRNVIYRLIVIYTKILSQMTTNEINFIKRGDPITQCEETIMVYSL